MGSELASVDARLAITDSPVGSRPEMLRCPWHDDGTESFAVYADGGYCFGCRRRLGRIETLAYLLYGDYAGANLKRAFAVASKYTGAAVDAYRARVDQSVKTEPLPYGLTRAYTNILYGVRKDRLQWLYGRGLSRAIISTLGIGHDGTRFTIPVDDADGHLVTIRFRRDDAYGTTEFDRRRGEDRPIPKYAGMPGRNGLFLYPMGMIAARVPYDDGYLVVVEGELDAARLWQEGIPAVSPTNGAGNVPKVPALLKRDFPFITRLFLATDQDEPGQDAAIDAFASARREGFRVTRISWDPLWGKDVTELLLNGHTLEEATFDGDEDRLPSR